MKDDKFLNFDQPNKVIFGRLFLIISLFLNKPAFK